MLLIDIPIAVSFNANNTDTLTINVDAIQAIYAFDGTSCRLSLGCKTLDGFDYFMVQMSKEDLLKKIAEEEFIKYMKR